jgi:hypothetical protein
VSLPGGLNTITVTGSYTDITGAALAGSVVFTPTSAVTDAAGKAILGATSVVEPLNSLGAFSVVLPCTDNTGLTPVGWGYTVTVNVPGAQGTITPVYLPHALGTTVDISALTASVASPAPSGVSYIPNATAVPSAGPSVGGGFLYSSAGALYWIGPSNTAHLIAPA